MLASAEAVVRATFEPARQMNTQAAQQVLDKLSKAVDTNELECTSLKSGVRPVLMRQSAHVEDLTKRQAARYVEHVR